MQYFSQFVGWHPPWLNLSEGTTYIRAPGGGGGGQSHSGGDAYVRRKRPPFSASLSPKDPSFFIIACALTQRPHKFLYFSLTECQISLTEWKKSCSHQVTPHF